MIVFFTFLILFIGAKNMGIRGFFDDNFNISQTNALKGFCAITVVFHHLCTYLSDCFSSLFFFEHIGFLMVGIFFFISGYGLMYGLDNKENYLKSFFKKRIVVILVPYYIINIFYIISRNIARALDFKYIILSMFGYHLWYVMAIIILYIGFWASFRIFGTKKGIYAISIYTIIYILVLYIAYKYLGINNFGFWWYNSILCFVIGLWYSRYKDCINKVFKKKFIPIFIITITIFCLCMHYTSARYNEATLALLLTEILCSLAFALLIVLVSMKIQFNNKILNICGKISLELYLSHALFIFFLRSELNIFGYTVYISTNWLYLLLILAGSFIFSYLVHKTSAFLLKKIFN